MPTRDEFLVAELQSTSENDWSVSQNKRFRASIIVWGMPKSLSTLEIRAKLADIGEGYDTGLLGVRDFRISVISN